MLKEPGSDQCAEGIRSKDNGSRYEVYSTNFIATIFAQIVGDDEACIGPADNDWPFEFQLRDHGRNIVSPFVAVSYARIWVTAG